MAEENVENSSEVNVTIGANQLRRRSGTSLVTISRSLTRCNCMAQGLKLLVQEEGQDLSQHRQHRQRHLHRHQQCYRERRGQRGK